MSVRANLRVVDVETGELSEHSCPSCQALEDLLAGAERDVRGWRARYAQLKRDKDLEAREHPLWPQAVQVFDAWRRECRHPNSRWNADRFWLLAPLLEEYGQELCLRAIAGAAFDPFCTKRKNGTIKRHDGFELVFKDAGKLEEMANRSPLA